MLDYQQASSNIIIILLSEPIVAELTSICESSEAAIATPSVVSGARS